MPTFSLSDLPKNAVLAEAILDAQGRILLREGLVVTPSVMRVLQRWNVTQVAITTSASSPAPGGTETNDTTSQFPISSDWEPLFEKHAADPEMQKILAGLKLWAAARGETKSTETPA